MKRSLFLLLALASAGTFAGADTPAAEYFAPVDNLGNVMYVGDSITHGVAAASYRWPLFKIWVDNGISQQEVGVHVRNHSGGVQPNTTYGGVTFLNVHSAISSERAYEIAGRINKSGRLENSNIFDWLGLDKGYTGKRRIDPATQNPASYFMMIGTNDTLSDAGKAGIHSCLAEKEKNLLGKGGDLDTIIHAMRRANPGARIAVTTIPTWAPGRNNNAAPEDFAAIEHYNEQLRAWGRANKVAVVEVNRGMVDVSDARAFIGLPAMFGRDRLHPSPHGDLIIAGNIAQQLGYAGRTAGLARKAASEFPLQAAQLAKGGRLVKTGRKGSISIAAGGNVHHRASGGASTGSTVELRFSSRGYGDGGKDGWAAEEPLGILLSTGSVSGTLSVSESAIRWEGRTLYSADMSELRDPIRMAWVPGASAMGVEGGFYVWLGDMLIGEALPGTEIQGAPMLDISPGWPGVQLASLAYDPTQSWAPASSRFSAGNPVFEGSAAPAASAARVVDSPLPEALRPQGGPADIILSGRASAPSGQWNALCVGHREGSVNLTVSGDYAGSQAWGPFFASANGQGVAGDATLRVNAASFRLQSGKFGPVHCALAGAHESSVQGTVSFVLSNGRYEGNIYGGAIGKSPKTRIGSTHIELGAATVTGDVCAGGLSGSIAGDATVILHGTATLTGRRISGGTNVKGTRKLVLDKVQAAPAASLADFDEIHVTKGSVLTLADLGGAKKLVVDATSRVTLAPGSYEASVLNSGTIELAAGCTLSLRPEGTDENETGSYVVKGTLKANNVRMSNSIRLEGGRAEGLGEGSFRGTLQK